MKRLFPPHTADAPARTVIFLSGGGSDAEAVLDSLGRTGVLAVAEDVCHEGGAGSRILALCAEKGIALSAVRIADLGDGVVPHGSREQLLRDYSLDAQSLATTAKALLEKDPV